MISIVVSSYKPDLFLQFQNNVANTIGVEYEIIKVDNPGLMGLCAAYNIGISRAKYDYICFSHEDILFYTQNWGLNLIETFKSDEKIGIIGIAGASYKPYVPSGWSFPQGKEAIKMYLLQIRNNKLSKIFNNPSNDSISFVASVDGCWFCSKREVVEQYKFDEQLFQKYHCYDIDFSLSVGLTYKVAVIYDIMIEHLSEGSFDRSWIEETLKLHTKWKDLPRMTTHFTSAQILEQESGAYLDLIKKMCKINSIDFKVLFDVLYASRLRKLLGYSNWVKLHFKVLSKLVVNANEKLAYKVRIKK